MAFGNEKCLQNGAYLLQRILIFDPDNFFDQFEFLGLNVHGRLVLLSTKVDFSFIGSVSIWFKLNA